MIKLKKKNRKFKKYNYISLAPFSTPFKMRLPHFERFDLILRQIIQTFYGGTYHTSMRMIILTGE